MLPAPPLRPHPRAMISTRRASNTTTTTIITTIRRSQKPRGDREVSHRTPGNLVFWQLDSVHVAIGELATLYLYYFALIGSLWRINTRQPMSSRSCLSDFPHATIVSKTKTFHSSQFLFHIHRYWKQDRRWIKPLRRDWVRWFEQTELRLWRQIHEL